VGFAVQMMHRCLLLSKALLFSSLVLLFSLPADCCCRRLAGYQRGSWLLRGLAMRVDRKICFHPRIIIFFFGTLFTLHHQLLVAWRPCSAKNQLLCPFVKILHFLRTQMPAFFIALVHLKQAAVQSITS
jgi:hypothetical protein